MPVRSTLTKLAVAVVVVGGLAISARSASGTTAAPLLAPVPNSHSVGAVTLFDAMGLPVSAGGDLNHLADFAQSDSPVASAARTSLMYFAIPDTAIADPNRWTATQASSESSFPTVALGASLSEPTVATVTLSPQEGNLSSFLLRLGKHGSLVVELRLLTASGGHTNMVSYWTVDLDVDVNAGTWSTLGTAVPAPVPTYLSAVTPGPQHASGDPLTLSAKLATADGAHPAGTVELFDGVTDNGPALYDQATGTVAASVLPQSGDRRYRFVFTPYDPTQARPAQSAQLACTIHGGIVQPLREKLVLLAIPAASHTALSVTTLFAYLSPPSAHGRVTFTDSLSGALGEAEVAGGVATLLTNALSAGTHVVVATFAAGANQPFGPASKSARSFTLAPGATASSGVDAQSAKVSVNPGQLTITTPYTPDHPFDLGSLVLAADGSKLTASGHFGTASTASSAGVTVTDTRGGDGAWTASLSSTNFVSGLNSISAQNLGFVNIHSVAPDGSGGGGLGTDAKPVVTTDLLPSMTVAGPDAPGTAGLAGNSKSFAKAAHGAGSVYLYGDIVLNAPTASAAGSYTATLTFTVG